MKRGGISATYTFFLGLLPVTKLYLIIYSLPANGYLEFNKLFFDNEHYFVTLQIAYSLTCSRQCTNITISHKN
jgi:hypothetical protein